MGEVMWTLNRNLLAFAAVLLCGIAYPQGQKVGHIDRGQLIMQMPERAAAVTKMEAFAKTQEARLKAMADEYKAKRATAEAPPAELSKTEREMMLRELQDLEQRIMTAQEKAEEDMAKMEQELILPVVQKANEAIRTVASEQQFTYVIDSSVGLLLIHQGTDLMAAVKTKLGIK